MKDREANEDQAGDPILVKKKIEEALSIIKDLGFERGQHNETAK